MYVPWSLETVTSHDSIMQMLLSKSYLPATPETGFHDPTLTHISSTLLPTSKCKICNMLFEAVLEHNPPDSFFSEYATLCFYVLHAPVTWSATYITICDMLQIFSNAGLNHLITEKINSSKIMGIDFYLHFFARQCFRHTTPDQVAQLENLHQVRLSLLSNTICNVQSAAHIQGIWSSSLETAHKKGAQSPDPPTGCPVKAVPHREFFSNTNRPSLLKIFSEAWKRSLLLDPDYSEPDTPVETVDTSQGPCLLSFPFSLKCRGNTSSVCVLCECLACHPEAARILQEIKSTILTCLENNTSLLDRTAYTLMMYTTSKLIDDPDLAEIITSRGPNVLHKHLFCDPFCAINSLKTDPLVLFKYPSGPKFQIFTKALASGKYLAENALFDQPETELLVLALKACQLAQFPKKFEAEVLKGISRLGTTLTTVSPVHFFSVYT
nr:68 [Murid gammaherpesvirus 4]